jgi:small-conductance mechanosensitive channel
MFMKFLLSLLRGLCLAALCAGTAAAAPPSVDAADADAKLDQARVRIDSIRKALDGKPADTELVQWRTTALKLQSEADTLTEVLAPRLDDITARLDQLGPVPAGAKEPRDVADLRAQLEKASRDAGTQLKLAKLLSVDAAQTAERISAMRRALFQARMGERRGTIFSPAFWAELHTEAPRDLRRLGELASELKASASQTPGWIWTLLAVGLAALLAAHLGIRRLLLRITSTRVPPGRLRRSFLATVLALLGVATPGLIALLARLGLNWTGALTDETDTMLGGLVGMVCLAGYVNGLGHALLAVRRPSWRLLSLPDAVARGLRWLPATLAVLAVAVWLAHELPTLLDISLVMTITLNSLTAMALGVAMAGALTRGERLRRRALADEESGRAPPRAFWVAALSTTAWLALIVAVLATLIGYAAFGSFVVTQGLWLLVVAASAYLLSMLIEDGFTTLLAQHLPEKPTPQSRLRQQAAVLLAGAGRVAVLLAAIALLANPLGDGPGDLLRGLDQLRHGVQIGEINIQPGALLESIVALVLGLACVRLLRHWLRHRYLPTTTLDPGMQMSAATLFGYAGVVFSVALSLSVLGLGLERVAWIASALSVGIGFGLQAVVQNFVSGLILLAERPVKVGDWVSLSGVEGDILRINVRATEIQMQDRSTVIVPNSEFITKTVRNVTHANSLGRVQIRLPMPLSSDAQRVREIILEAFAAQEDMLETPEASVYLDGIESDRLIFNALGYVASPRQAYTMRSRLLFDVLQRLAQAGLAMSPASSPTMLLREIPSGADPATGKP